MICESNKRKRKRLRRRSSQVTSLFVACCLTKSASASAFFGSGVSGTNQEQKSFLPCVHDKPRGGHECENDDDAEANENSMLDAYIDALISSVEDVATVEDTANGKQKAANEPLSPRQMTSDLETVSFQQAKARGRGQKSDPGALLEEHNKNEDSVSQHRPKIPEKVTEKSDMNGAPKTVAFNMPSPKNKTSNEDACDDHSDPDSQYPRKDEVVDTTNPIETYQTDAASEDGLSKARPQPGPVTTIPNPLFRFLLHRGKIGHIVIMTIVLWFEWLAFYVPVISDSLDWLYVHMMPQSIREPRRLLATWGRQQRPSPPLASTASTTMARTGTSRRKRRELIRQADQKAFQQLKSLDSHARYRHVSLDFCKRHRLGPYRRQATISEKYGLVATGESTPTEITNTGGTGPADLRKVGIRRDKSKLVNKDKKKVVPEEKDWVIQALTEDRQRPDSRRTSKSSKATIVRPRISLQLGSQNGLSVGLEFSSDARDKYRQSVVQAVSRTYHPTSHSNRRLPGESGANSDPGGIMGRLRAAAGSSVSRSILGAYPRDAVPLNEAADSHGLSSLAERYGYSELQQDDDDHIKVTRRKRESKRSKTTRITNLQRNRLSSTVFKDHPNRSRSLISGRELSSTPSKTIPRRRGSLTDQLLSDKTSTGRSTLTKTVPRGKGSIADKLLDEPTPSLAKTIPRRKGSLADKLMAKESTGLSWSGAQPSDRVTSGHSRQDELRTKRDQGVDDNET